MGCKRDLNSCLALWTYSYWSACPETNVKKQSDFSRNGSDNCATYPVSLKLKAYTASKMYQFASSPKYVVSCCCAQLPGDVGPAF